MKQFLHRTSVRLTFAQILLLSGVSGLALAAVGGAFISVSAGLLVIGALLVTLFALTLVVFKFEHRLNVAQTELKSYQDIQQARLVQQLEKQNQAIEKERSDRIVTFARRDASSTLPQQVLVLVTVHRSGSTWLVDMLRSNPAIFMDPSARLFAELELQGGRYPIGLSNGPDADMDFENAPNQGTRIPRFDPLALMLPVAGDNPYALEKIHPQFFDYDVAAFLERIQKVEAKYGLRFKFVYQVRDPRAVLSSFLNYQRRDPQWYTSITMEKLVPFMHQAYQAILDMARLRPDTILDYTDLKHDPQGVLINLYTSMWPTEDIDLLRQVAEYAVASTRREQRQENAPHFLGIAEGPVRGFTLDNGEFFDRFSNGIEDMYEPYQALLTNGKQSLMCLDE